MEGPLTLPSSRERSVVVGCGSESETAAEAVNLNEALLSGI